MYPSINCSNKYKEINIKNDVVRPPKSTKPIITTGMVTTKAPT